MGVLRTYVKQKKAEERDAGPKTGQPANAGKTNKMSSMLPKDKSWSIINVFWKVLNSDCF